MEKYKDKLIELFKKSCMDLTIPRSKSYISLDVHHDTQVEIRNTAFPKKLGSFSRYNWYVNSIPYYLGFQYNDLPPLAIGNIYAEYEIKYGTFFPIISYFFVNNYINRKKYMAEAEQLVGNNPMYYKLWLDDLKKTIRFKGYKPFIIHGTIFSILTPEERDELNSLYQAQVSVYDEMKLNERLSK